VSTATLNGHACTRVRVQVPDWGAPWADVDLAEPEALAPGAAVTLVLADKTIAGAVVSGGVADGRAAYRIVGGAGGWGRDLKRKGYRNDGGAYARNVITDAATECGEQVADLPTTRLGPHYARPEGPASRVLNALAPRSWRVDFDGVTRFGTRAQVAYSGDGTRTKLDPAGAVIEIATDTIGDLVPGVTIDGSNPAADVEYVLDDKRLTVRVYSSARTSRRLEALRRIVASLFPEIRYSGAFEYRVVTQQGERFNLQPARVSTGMPDLAGVPARGPAGVKATVTPGELVLVVFADRDPSRPNIIAHDAPDAPGWMPLFLELGGPGALGIARQTDPVQAGPFAGVITGGSLRVKASL
jgi:hypothetical protein